MLLLLDDADHPAGEGRALRKRVTWQGIDSRYWIIRHCIFILLGMTGACVRKETGSMYVALDGEVASSQLSRPRSRHYAEHTVWHPLARYRSA